MNDEAWKFAWYVSLRLAAIVTAILMIGGALALVVYLVRLAVGLP